MADTGIFCTTAEVLRKAGVDSSSTSQAEAYTNDFVAQAESYINVTTRYNWSDDYAALNADVKSILKEAASNLAATYVINYDKKGFLSDSYAMSMIAFLLARADECLYYLIDIKRQEFIEGET